MGGYDWGMASENDETKWRQFSIAALMAVTGTICCLLAVIRYFFPDESLPNVFLSAAGLFLFIAFALVCDILRMIDERQ